MKGRCAMTTTTERDPVQVARNPFARASLMRRLVPSPIHNCRWCGGLGRFDYAWVADDKPLSRAGWSGPFCSLSCFKAYGGES